MRELCRSETSARSVLEHGSAPRCGATRLAMAHWLVAHMKEKKLTRTMDPEWKKAIVGKQGREDDEQVKRKKNGSRVKCGINFDIR